MEIEATVNKLSKALNNVSRIATSRATLPVLNNVLIKVEKKRVSLVTTNLDMAMIDFLPVSNSKDGVITVPAKLLAEFVSNLPKKDNIKIKSDGDKITVTSGKYSSIINGSPADDFPELPEINEKEAVVFKMGIDEFKNSVSQVIIAASNDLNRPVLTGVHFYTSNKSLFIVATDAYRLAKKKLIKNVKSEIKVTIPASSLQEVIRSIDDHMEEIEISFNEDLIRFRLDELEIVSKIIDSEYINPDNFIPKDPKINLKVDKDELIRVAKLSSLFARQTTNDVITCETKSPDAFLVHSIANEYGKNDSSLDTKVTEDGKISITSRYLLDALNAINTPEVSISFNDNVEGLGVIDSAMVIKESNSDDYVHILMAIGQ